MTLHSAKGLEFDYVFLPGWEEGIFPNQRNIDDNGSKGLEEERRLGYVGITRARKKLTISYVNYRKQYNYSFYRSLPSRFLSELPKNCELVVSEKMKSLKKNQIIILVVIFQLVIIYFMKSLGKEKVLGINEKKTTNKV